MLPPTSLLPPLRREPALAAISSALDSLHAIYHPSAIKGARAHCDASNVEELSLDQHERDYVISWLNRLIDSDLAWLHNDPTPCGSSDAKSSQDLIDEAAALLERIIKGDAEDGGGGLEDDEAIERTFCFPFDFESASLPRSKRVPAADASQAHAPGAIAITLIDAPLPPSQSDAAPSTQNKTSAMSQLASDDEDGAPRIPDSLEASTAVGVQTWAAAIVLSDLLVTRPHEVHEALVQAQSDQSQRRRKRPLRVAELGAGTGLVGLVCAHALQLRHAQSERGEGDGPSSVGNDASKQDGDRPDEVVLTDFHPRVLANLRFNAEANPVSNAHPRRIQTPSPAAPEAEEASDDPTSAGQALSSGTHPDVLLTVAPLDWSTYYPSPPPPALRDPHVGSYDLLLAADVVYAREHASWLFATMRALLSRNRSARAHVLNAKRMQGRFGEWGLVSGTDEVFGPVFEEGQGEVSGGTALQLQLQLRVIRRVEFPKRKGLGRSDESGHVWWTLGWR